MPTRYRDQLSSWIRSLRRRIGFWTGVWLLVGSICATPTYGQTYSKPKVRAITGFVRLDRSNYQAKVAAALQVLHAAKREFESRGYAVETVRIVTQPLAELVPDESDTEALAFLEALDALSSKQQFILSVGPATLRDNDDPRFMSLLREALSTLTNINGSAIVAAEDGIHWNAVRESAALVRYVAAHSSNSQGTLNFTATAMLKPYGPFYPGAYHTGSGKRFSLGFESANIVQEVFAHARSTFSESTAELTTEVTQELTQQLAVHAKLAEEIGRHIAKSTGWTFMGVDPTPAPLGGVSIGAAIETFTGSRFGSSGTLTAARVITAAVKAVPVKQVGYSGLMVPVMEDEVLARRWAEGTFHTDSLLAYSAVCGTGLDTVPYPGDISESQLAAILGDVASLAWKWKKPLSARLQPIVAAGAGDPTRFNSPYLFNTTLQALP